MDEGGEPACWLGRVCPECGRLRDRPGPARCESCGAVDAESAEAVPESESAEAVPESESADAEPEEEPSAGSGGA
ncbi:hypothetical protein ACFYUY_26650 [Kitasatospora sp. NPDC004745]|uniref:hypothetical protein n=1 Tax=Kitasatospora sp. NPDC004745 TaxID=3364019 RepID=UPI0036C3A822